MDNLIKKYFDRYRLEGKLPPEIDGKVDGVLMADLDLLNKWRSWRTGLVYKDIETGAILSGALDDLLVNPHTKRVLASQDQNNTRSGVGVNPGGNLYMPFDYKTRGYDLKEDSSSFYQNQLDCYGLMLKANGLPPADHGYLCYYIPKEVSENGQVRFEITITKMAINPDSAQKTFEAAVELMASPIPSQHSTCEYCSWGNTLLGD